jgi:beta-mannosidase
MIVDLTGEWAVRQVKGSGGPADAGVEAGPTGEWMPAAVPGCIHLDLLKAKRIPDPFYGFNDKDVQWVAHAQWLYRRAFDCPPALLKLRKVELVCDGLDTFANVVLNGRPIGRANNMFRQWRWDVTGMLKAEGNELLVLFESPEEVGQALLDDDPEHLRASYSPGRTYTRKAQYAGGWDWGPGLNTSGIWRPIRLEGSNHGRLADVSTSVDWADPRKPVVQVTCEVDALGDCKVRLSAALSGEGFVGAAEAAARLSTGMNIVKLAIPVADPRLWWPAGFGAQDLYSLTVTGELGGEELPAAALAVGLRRIELRREKDAEGESFIICVNGQPIFCRGANWIPADSFIPRLTRSDYDALVGMAAAANMNILRVWGGGIYERPEFYDACDRLGIMVWQDFGFACGRYPDHLDDFRENVRVEAEQTVRRLRNYPSLVLWCGNNECQWLERKGGKLAGERLYAEVLPAVCAELDPSRPYWPSSPFGGEDPNSPTQGDQHLWTPWWEWRHPNAQRNFPGRFLSEFGFQAPPAMETIRRYVPSSGNHMQSRVMEHHNCAWEGTERLYRLLSIYFRVPCSMEDTVYLMQLMQGEAVKAGVEGWRARKFMTAGTLFWQLNDCWPVTSWSCIDYEHRPKALYYYARRFFAPVLPVIDGRGGRFAVKVINDRPEPFSGELVCGFGQLSGDQRWVQKVALSVPANGSAPGLAVEPADLHSEEPAREYFWCRLLKDGAEVAHNVAFLVPPKHLELDLPDWQLSVEQTAPRSFRVKVSSDCFAEGVWLRVEGAEAGFSDNFFDLLPEVATVVQVTTDSDMSADELRRRLRLKSVAHVTQNR